MNTITNANHVVVATSTTLIGEPENLVMTCDPLEGVFRLLTVIESKLVSLRLRGITKDLQNVFFSKLISNSGQIREDRSREILVKKGQKEDVC